MRLKKDISIASESEVLHSLGISIRGLALSHFDSNSNQWKIFFPKAPDHNLTLSVTKWEDGRIVGKDEFRLLTTEKIEIITEGKAGGGVNTPSSHEDIPDLSGQLHQETIHLINDRNRYAGFLILNETDLMTEPQQETTNVQIWKVVSTPTMIHRRLFAIKEIGVAATGAIDYEPGSTTEIRIGGEPPIVLTHAENIKYQVVLDNDCHQQTIGDCAESDFKFYYDIIDESQLQTKCRFELIPEKTKPDTGVNKGEIGGVCGSITAESLVIPAGLF